MKLNKRQFQYKYYFLALSLASVANFAAATRVVASTLVILDRVGSGDLGKGFIDTTKTITPGCLKGILERKYIENSYIEYSNGDDAEHIFTHISGKVTGSANLFVAGASSFGEFINRKADDSNGSSAFINVGYERLRVHLSKEVMTDLGKGTLGQSDEEIRSICGSSVVNDVVLGARLSIVARLVYVGSRDHKYSKYKVKAEVLGQILSRKSTIVESDHIRSDYVLNIDAYQWGGDQAELKSILGAGRKYCALDDVDLCSATYKQLVQYASDKFLKTTKKAPESSLAALKLSTALYSDLMMSKFFPPSELIHTSGSMFKNSAMAYYRSKLNKVLVQKESIEAKLYSGVFGTATVDFLKSELGSTDNQIKNLESRINSCDFAEFGTTYLCEM